ncbi:MAG: YkgJ family cysteine cluster protein [Smithella sp.]
MNEIKSICSECVKRKILANEGTCCQDSDVFVSLGDLKRICIYKNSFNFYEYREATEPYLEELKRCDDKLWNNVTITPKRMRRVLRKKGKNCIFLDENTGCTLPMEIKPLVCRIYPYGYDNAKIILDNNCGCPQDLLNLDSCNNAIEINFGVSIEKAELWRAQLYCELADEYFLDINA